MNFENIRKLAATVIISSLFLQSFGYAQEERQGRNPHQIPSGNEEFDLFCHHSREHSQCSSRHSPHSSEKDEDDDREDERSTPDPVVTQDGKEMMVVDVSQMDAQWFDEYLEGLSPQRKNEIEDDLTFKMQLTEDTDQTTVLVEKINPEQRNHPDRGITLVDKKTRERMQLLVFRKGEKHTLRIEARDGLVTEMDLWSTSLSDLKRRIESKSISTPKTAEALDNLRDFFTYEVEDHMDGIILGVPLTLGGVGMVAGAIVEATAGAGAVAEIILVALLGTIFGMSAGLGLLLVGAAVTAAGVGVMLVVAGSEKFVQKIARKISKRTASKHVAKLKDNSRNGPEQSISHKKFSTLKRILTDMRIHGNYIRTGHHEDSGPSSMKR